MTYLIELWVEFNYVSYFVTQGGSFQYTYKITSQQRLWKCFVVCLYGLLFQLCWDGVGIISRNNWNYNTNENIVYLS